MSGFRPSLSYAAAAILFASLGTLVAALGFQFLGGLQPCPLCIAQRWPHVAIVLVAAFALGVAPHDKRAAGLLIAICGIVYLVGSGIAIYHTGVEQHWWQGSAECTSPRGASGLSIEQLTARLLATPLVRCDEIPWSLLGLSMAGWNALLSTGLAAMSLVAAWHLGPWRK